MDVEFMVVGYLLIMAMCSSYCIYSLLFEWLPDYLKKRKATAADRATEWVNNHPLKGRKAR